ncbi:MAG: dienelactone hydrolase family protein [Dehalococcoidia bacterium]
MITRDITHGADGATLVGRLALPDGEGKRPAILIAHEGPGLDDFQKHRAEQFAELGYVTFALDYHGGGQPLVDRDTMNSRLRMLMANPDRALALAHAGLDVLLAEPRADAARVAAVGYCFGGTLVLELACGGAALKAVVGFHPGLPLLRPEAAGSIVAKVLVCVGADDPIVPVEHRLAFEAQMRAGGVDWRMNLYGGVQHSFTHPHADRAAIPGIKYDEQADRRSWRAMRDLFDETFA